MSPHRLEGFSDGVVAVAITLLVLDLAVPAPGDGPLASRLIALWPNLLAYVISFVAIGIIWINHHTMVSRLETIDHSFLILNVILLMCIALLPFSTSLMATYLDQPAGGHLAGVVYAATFLATSVVFFVMQRHVLVRRPALLRVPMNGGQRRAVLGRAMIAPPGYLLAGAGALVTPYLTLGICVALGTFYLTAPGKRAG